MLFYDIPKVTGSKRLRFWRGAIHCRNGSETDASMRFDRSDHRCDVSHCVQHHFRGWTSGKTVPIWSKIQCTLPPCSFKDLGISMVNLVHVCPCYIRFLWFLCNIICITSPHGLKAIQVHLADSCDVTPTSPAPNTTLPVLLQRCRKTSQILWAKDVTDTWSANSPRPKTPNNETKKRRMLNVCWIFEGKKHLAGWMDIWKRNGLQRWMHLICSRVRGRRPRETLHRIERENMVSDSVFCLFKNCSKRVPKTSVLCWFFC